MSLHLCLLQCTNHPNVFGTQRFKFFIVRGFRGGKAKSKMVKIMFLAQMLEKATNLHPKWFCSSETGNLLILNLRNSPTLRIYKCVCYQRTSVAKRSPKQKHEGCTRSLMHGCHGLSYALPHGLPCCVLPRGSVPSGGCLQIPQTNPKGWWLADSSRHRLCCPWTGEFSLKVTSENWKSSPKAEFAEVHLNLHHKLFLKQIQFWKWKMHPIT